MNRFSEIKPPLNKTVMFIWWHRNGFETSQKTLGILNEDGSLTLDFKPGGNKAPDLWKNINQ